MRDLPAGSGSGLVSVAAAASSKTTRNASAPAVASTSRGRKSSSIRSLTTPDASLFTNPTSPRIIARLARGGTSTTIPKSKYTSSPRSLTTRFPGCGSECMNPVSKS